MDKNEFVEKFIEVEIEAEKLLLGRHEVNWSDIVVKLQLQMLFSYLMC